MANRFETLVEIPLAEVDVEDQTYSIGLPGLPVGNLLESVKKVGILNPLCVEGRDKEPYRIVCGFRRAQVAGQLGLQSLPCWIRRNEGGSHLFVQSLMDNVGSRPLHDLEKATAVRKLIQNFGIAQETVVEEFLPLLGIRSTLFHLKRYLRLAELPPLLQRPIVDGRLDLGAGLAMADWSALEQQELVGLLGRYRLNVNTQKQAVELLDELRRKTGRNACDLCQAAEKEAGPPNQSSHGFEAGLAALRRMRMPRLTDMEERYHRLKAGLKLPPDIRVQPPQYFEGERLGVSFSASSCAELRRSAERLLAAAQTREMEEIFELL